MAAPETGLSDPLNERRFSFAMRFTGRPGFCCCCMVLSKKDALRVRRVFSIVRRVFRKS